MLAGQYTVEDAICLMCHQRCWLCSAELKVQPAPVIRPNATLGTGGSCLALRVRCSLQFVPGSREAYFIGPAA